MLRPPKRNFRPFDEARHVEQLISTYRQGFEEILRVIIRKEAKGQWTDYWRDLLLDVREILRQLDTFADLWIETTVGQVYSEAVANTRAYLQGVLEREPVKPKFAQIHQRAVDVIAQNGANNLRSATQFVGRRVNDIFRQVALEAATGKLAAGATVRDMKNEMIRRLLDRGQTCFIDRIGRRWRLDTYAAMVARTTTRETATVAVLNECAEFGLDLVRITTHHPTCERCAPLQGKVFSISGADKRYPKLLPEYTPPIHPNCRHVLVPYVREFDEDAEETERFSREPLRRDTRSPEEKRAYEQQQRQKQPVAGEFGELSEALKWAQTSYPDIEWDFQGATIDTINPTLKQFHQLAQLYPDAVRFMKALKVRQLPNYVFALYDPSSANRGIYLNRVFYGDKATFLSTLGKSVQDGFHPPGCDTIESILAHEFAHLVDDWLHTTALREGVAILPVVGMDGVGLVDDTLRQFKWQWFNRKDAVAALSKYAQTNPDEMFAEAFASLYAGAGLGRIVQHLKVLLDEVACPEKWLKDWRFLTEVPLDEVPKARAAIDQLRRKLGLTSP